MRRSGYSDGRRTAYTRWLEWLVAKYGEHLVSIWQDCPEADRFERWILRQSPSALSDDMVDFGRRGKPDYLPTRYRVRSRPALTKAGATDEFYNHSGG